MKVLWFSNSPGNAVHYLNETFVGSSWIQSLDKGIQNFVDLHIAFFYPKKKDVFSYGSTTYYPIGRKNWKLSVLKEIFFRKAFNGNDLRQCLEIIDLVSPDIIHIHGTENHLIKILPFVNVPVVVSVQGYITVIEHKYKNMYSNTDLLLSKFYNKGGIKSILLNRSFYRIWKEMGITKSVEQNSLRLVEHIIGRTNWDRRVSSLLAPNAKYHFCNEIMRDIFYKKIWQHKRNKVFLVHSTLGNNPYKGFETVCEALSVISNFTDLKVQWQIAGLSQTDSIVRITEKKLKKSFPIEELHYLGRLDEIKLVEFLCKADIFVSPSHIENSPNSLSEAMLIGMPCIATYAGGTGSLLTDSEDGILIQDGDPWALAGSVIELCRDHDLACKLGQNARHTALNRHDPHKIVNDQISIYQKIVSSRI